MRFQVFREETGMTLPSARRTEISDRTKRYKRNIKSTGGRRNNCTQKLQFREEELQWTQIVMPLFIVTY